MIYSQSPQNQNDSFYQQQQQNNQDHQYYGSNPDLIPIKNCKFLHKIIIQKRDISSEKMELIFTTLLWMGF